MVGKSGKIEEISASVFEKVFSRAKIDVNRVKALSILHIIPEFVKIFMNEKYSKDDVFKSLMIFTKKARVAEERFKIYKS